MLSEDTTKKENGVHSTAFLAYLIITAALCGALVMVIEVLGSRVIGPFFGVSLFVWTSLITVTLVALAAGYAAGGLLSDRRSSPSYLYGIILTAGVLTLLIPVLKGAVLKSCIPLGLRTGALTSSAVLFGPALFSLGCVSPYIVKIAAREMKNIGRTVGIFYAISTIGSFIGTVLTGFVLIAYFSVGRIFVFVGFVLILLAVVFFTAFRRKLYPIIFLVLPLFIAKETVFLHKTLPSGTEVKRIADLDSFYGNIKVVEYYYGQRHTREMMIDGLVQGGININNGMSVYEYSYFMGFLPYGMNPHGRDCLVIGLGAGLIPGWYEQRGIRTKVVDINPNVVDISKRYFGFRPNTEVVVSDARFYLTSSGDKFDYIIVDVFNGDTTPEHLLSIESFRLLKEKMNRKGIIAFNLIGSLREPLVTASIVKTLREVFAVVKIYPEFDLKEGDGFGNISVLAFDDPSLNFDPARVRDFPVDSLAEEGVRKYLGKEYQMPPNTPAMILTDDYNPADLFDLKVKEALRKGILDSTDWDILI